MQKHQISVGEDGCDILGFTNQHIQAAVDRLFFMGGGTVTLSEGAFHCADAVHLRSGVHLRGQGMQTILRKNAMKMSPLSGYIAYGHEDLIVADPDLFEIGDGFIVGDNNSGGFKETQGFIIGKEDGYLIASTKHETDYWHTRDGALKTLYPLLSVINQKNVFIESVQLQGNSAENDTLNGCRGGAFFGHFSDDVHLCDVHVRDFNGEGFSFQTCNGMHIEQSSAIGCMGNGFHPGSGSIDFYIHDCQASENHQSGLFYCVRVRDSLLENCDFSHNKRFGVSIGERDVDSINRRLKCHQNGGPGIYFRGGDHAVASHRTLVEACDIAHNGGPAQIEVKGHVEGIELYKNQLTGGCGIAIAAEVISINCEDNQFACDIEIEDKREA